MQHRRRIHCQKVAEATAEAAARSRDEGIRIANLNNIKSIMRNMHLSAEKAMEAIGIPKSDFTRYLALL